MSIIFYKNYRAICLFFCLVTSLLLQGCGKGGPCVSSVPAFLFRLQDVSQFDAFKRANQPLNPDSVRIIAISESGALADTMKILFYTENDPAGTPRLYLRSTDIVERVVSSPAARFLLRYKSSFADTISLSLKQSQNENCSYYLIEKAMLNKNLLTQNDRFSNAYIITRPF